MIPKFDSLVQVLSGTKPWQQLNEQRLKSIRGRIFGWFLGFALLLLGLSLLLFGEITSGFGALVMSVVMVIISYRITHKQYSEQYKKLVVPPLVSNIITHSIPLDTLDKKRNRCKFNHQGHIDLDLLLSIPLFQKYDEGIISYHGEDLFSGTIDKTDFQFSDFVIQKNYDLILVDQDIDITTFRGLVFIADFHKSFDGTTTLKTRKGKIYKHQTMTGSSMKTASHEFDKMFKISTTDEITGRYLLPANMLERIINLRKLFPGQGMAICLHDGMLIISIHGVDFFEAKGLKKLEKQNLLRTYEEIKAIVEIIHLLNLNLRIWNKQKKDFIAK
ncbi:DUF3137 domain-containing protein [Sporosarcina sp. FSL K6-3457]|uniref:DUF3137 domain-containing protein n=1 Tax=Sporosarcina sp. FSL K6-3457 TaxID=2978204 RepID=UPI0030F94670